MPTAPTSSSTKTPASRWARWILGRSCLLNGVLAVMVLIRGSRPPHRIDESDSSVTLKPELPASTQTSPAQPPATGAFVPSRFQIWSTLESTNLLLYAENLRKAGCPEKTVCDIVVPALERWEADRFSEVAIAHSDAGSNYWATGKRRREINAVMHQEREKIRIESKQVRNSLLCPDTEPFEQENEQDFLVFGFLRPDQLQGIEQLLAKAAERIENWQEKGWGVSARSAPERARQPSDLLQIQAEVKAFDTDVARLMSPAELEELKARYYYFERGSFRQTNSPFDSSGISPAELRSLTLLQIQAEKNPMATLNPYWSIWDQLQESLSDENAAPPVDDLIALLGPQRTAEYLRATDPTYNDLRELLSARRLPPELADAGYALVQQSLSTLNQLRAEAWQDPPSVRQGMKELRQGLLEQWGAMLAGIPEDARTAELKLWTDQALRRAWEQAGKGP